MEIQKRNIKKSVEIPELSIEISKDEMKEIIIEKIKEHFGIDVLPEAISFKTGWKYVEDEWGMNRSQVSYFEGAKVAIGMKELEDINSEWRKTKDVRE